MKTLLFPLLFLVVCEAVAQPVTQKLATAMQVLEADSQMRHAIIGFSVYDGKTGLPLYEHNAQLGLAPASTQKIFTSCAAFELLGSSYRYITRVQYRYMINNPANGYLLVSPSGDPGFGSHRYLSESVDSILDSIVLNLRRTHLKTISLKYKIDNHFDDNPPGGWIWEDIGNYYGAAAQGFNWMENQYELLLKSGNNIGDTVTVAAVQPPEAGAAMDVQLSAAEKGSGDNTIVYLPYAAGVSSIRGTIPVNEKAFSVSASILRPYIVFSRQLAARLKAAGVQAVDVYQTPVEYTATDEPLMKSVELLNHASPSFDTLNHWFLRKSINLYGEAFIKTMAQKKWGTGLTEKGVQLLKDFWSEHGIEKSALHICDGSGLSPQNRVTADALVHALLFAKTRSWFPSFYDALPEYNGMKMKSGSIGGARAFAGYHSAKSGSEYVFSIIINNYDGASLAAVRKMYKVLDVLK